MVFTNTTEVWLRVGANALLFVTGFVVIYHAIIGIGRSRGKGVETRRTPHMRRWLKQPAITALRKLLLTGIREEGIQIRQQLLYACGLPWEATTYMAFKRFGLLLLAGIAGAGGIAGPILSGIGIPLRAGEIALYAVSGIALLLSDKLLLEQLKKRRGHTIIKEVYAVSRQLLYYSDSRMNLHVKLTRCLPYTRTIRGDLLLLLNEWYADAEEALNRFKRRVGTDEAHSFAETVQALRLNDSEYYYELLRQRIRDYKEKLELVKDSKKETTSYMLFVLAGLPILNTFRVFAYPWLEEGKKLFETLN